MKFFLDTAHVPDIREGVSLGLCDGVTGATSEVRARLVVNAAGCWTDAVNLRAGITKLGESSQKMGAAMYAAAEAEQSAAGGSTGSTGEADDDGAAASFENPPKAGLLVLGLSVMVVASSAPRKAARSST